MPSGDLEHGEAGMGLAENVRVLEKLPSGLGYCAADRNFSLNELAINILHNVFLNRNK